MGTVLKPSPSIWGDRQDRAALHLRDALLRHLQERWDGDLTKQQERLIRDASLSDLHRFLRRTQYAPGPGEVFDPSWRLAAEYIDLEHLIRHALGSPIGRWGILLVLKGSSRASAEVSEDVPWLEDLRRAPTAIADLRRRGSIFVACASSEEANTLRRAVRRSRIQVTLFRPDGHTAQG